MVLSPHTILIVEDIDSTMEWLVSVASEIFPEASISQATTLKAARESSNSAAFDLMLVDLGLPDGSGLDLIKEVRSKAKDKPYIVVTTIFDDDEHLRSALRLGANGYLLKDDEREEMIRNLRNLTRNRPPLSTRALNKMIEQYQPESAASLVALTTREEDVLRLIAKGYNVTETAKVLNLTSNTVKGYLKTVYSKLNISTRAEATAEAIRRNLVTP